MVLEPLSAISLAGNVVQFIDFCSKLLAESWELYRSSAGATASNLELEKTAESLGQLSDRINFSLESRTGATDYQPSTDKATNAEEALRNTAISCRRVADDLLKTLHDLRVKGPNKKWQSFLQPLRGIQKKEQIEQMSRRLSKYREELSLHLVTILNEHQVTISSKLDSLTYENERMQINRTAQFNELSKDLRSLDFTTGSIKMMIEKEASDRLERDRLQKEASDRLKKETSDRLKKETSDRLKKEASDRLEKEVSDRLSRSLSEFVQTSDELAKTLNRISRSLSHFVQTSDELAKEQKILRSLQFASMNIRLSAIAEAHKKTFSWVFDAHADADDPRSQIKFRDWLKHGDGVYWVSGKAGSGKSTLMRYLHDDVRTRKALSRWAGNQDFVLASFFFWGSGTEMQKSQRGLLQSLLFEILRRCPALIRNSCPLRWSQTALLSNWTVSELSQTFQRLMVEQTPKFCFPIDGLDEYGGDHFEIIEALKGFAVSPNIKLCLSSRPWNIFEHVFGQDPRRKLYLQDLTREDIELYVQSKLAENDIFRRLKEKDPRYQDLISEITAKAQGVFLWVFLVVRSLLQGLLNADRISDLQRRLRRLPSDLERFFRYMLDSIDDIYREQTVRIFQVSIHVREPLPFLTFWFLEEEDPDYAVKIAARPLDEKETLLRLEETRKRLDGRCKGLLEVTKDPSVFQFRVDFLHRTVKDWFKTSEMQDVMADRLDDTFNAHTALCNAFLAHVKCLPSPVPKRALLRMGQDILYHADQVEKETGVRRTLVLKELYVVSYVFSRSLDGE
ncbi:hypothetical protein V2W45_1430275 [Cenococcum geophilum]